MKEVLLILVALVFSVTETSAEKYVAPGHHHFHSWYKKIQKELGISNCCDEQSNDCGPVDSYIDLGYGRGAKVILEDQKWYDTQDSHKKYYVDTPDGRAHVCRQPSRNDYGHLSGGFSFFCVFLPKPVG